MGDKEYKVNSFAAQDREGLYKSIKDYLAQKGFKPIGSDNATRSFFGSDLGAVIVSNAYDFNTTVYVGTSNKSFLEELTLNFPQLKETR